MTPEPSLQVAIAVIGRNEGERLRRCLRSVTGSVALVVYADSGSTDGSPEFAAQMGCHVVRLDPAQPFTAARARNEAAACIFELAPAVSFIQFLDGDCELDEGWLEQALAALSRRSDAAIVCGRVREARPRASVYNRLCDLEWRQPPGEILASGGRFVIRRDVFRAVGGFRADVIAAEDDEFCIRVRALGWKILAIDASMARHDAAIMHFSQWARRARRTGYAFAQVAALHAHGTEHYFRRDCRKTWFWGLLLPVAALIAAPFTYGLSLLAAVAAYAAQFLRIYGHGRKRGWSVGESVLNSFFVVISRFPAILGLLQYHWRMVRKRAPRLIEYKKDS